jgi:protein SCO1
MKTLHDVTATRRGLVGALLAAGAASPAGAQSPLRTPAPAPAEDSRTRLREMRTPNVPLVDQDGRTLNFYDDVMKNRKVLVNVMYTVCSNVCTPATHHLIEARRLLGDEARDLHFVSLSLTPREDTPQALREYKKLHGIDSEWTFLTGKLEPMERVQRALGFLGNRDTDDLLSHSAMARLCDERNLRWSHVNTLLSPRSIARMIRFELA